MKPRNVGCSLVTFLMCFQVPFWSDWSGWIVAVAIFIFSNELWQQVVYEYRCLSVGIQYLYWLSLDDCYGFHWLWEQGPKEKRIKWNQSETFWNSVSSFSNDHATMTPMNSYVISWLLFTFPAAGHKQSAWECSYTSPWRPVKKIER